MHNFLSHKINSLEHVAHLQIGDHINRGISGGQRKRVNIGTELAAGKHEEKWL